MRIVKSSALDRGPRRHGLARRAAQAPQPAAQTAPAAPPNPQLAQYKQNVGLEVDAMGENIQKMNDTVFSFAELGFQEFETTKYLTGILRAERLQDRARRRRHSDGVDRAVGIGQAGDRARLRRRLHPAGVAEARRRVSRSDHRGRAGPRRRTQLGHAAADCRRARGEEGDGAAAPAGHADALARHRRGAGRHEGVLRARRHVQGRGHLDLRPRRRTTSASAGATATRTASSRSSTSSRARARTPPPRRGAASRRSTPSS